MIVMDMSAALSPFLSQLNGRRIPITYDDNNRPVKGTPVVFTTIGSIQEATAKDLKLLPEGEYQEEVFLYLSKDSLLSGLDDSVLTPDQITFFGQWYKVILKAQWQLYNYYRYLIRKIDAGIT